MFEMFTRVSAGGATFTPDHYVRRHIQDGTSPQIENELQAKQWKKEQAVPVRVLGEGQGVCTAEAAKRENRCKGGSIHGSPWGRSEMVQAGSALYCTGVGFHTGSVYDTQGYQYRPSRRLSRLRLLARTSGLWPG